MKHVRKFLALTLVLVLALGIVGCAAPAAPDTSDAQAPAEQTTDESKPIKLTLWSCNSMIRPNELKEGQETWYISQAIERFRELHPNVTIEINAYNDNAQLMNDFKAATRASPELPMNPGTAYRRLKTLLEEAGLPSIRFHDLRHTFATHALTSGVDAKTLAGILGHTNASFTLDTYTHVTPDMREAAGGIVGGFMENLFGKELKPWQRSEKQATD